MKLEYLTAFLLCIFLMTISIPNLFADEYFRLAAGQNGHFQNNQNLFSTQRINDIEEETDYKIRRKSADVSVGNIAKYGLDVLRLSGSYNQLRDIKLRTGFSSLSRNAAAGVQLVVSW